MKSNFLSRVLHPRQSMTLVLGALTAMLAILAGVSSLVYPSVYAPLLFLMGLLTMLAIIACLAKPVLALYGALILVLLPSGMIPASIHSVLNRSLAMIAVGIWLIRLLWDRKKIIWTSPTLFMLSFLMWSGLTILWAEKSSPATNAIQVYSLRFLLFMFLIPNEIGTKRHLNGFMKSLAISWWILLFSAIGTLILKGYTAGSRFKIFGENENGAAILIFVTLSGVLWQISMSSRYHRGLKMLMVAIFILLTLSFIVMSGSRGGAISLIVAMVAFYAWKVTRPWGKMALLVTILALLFAPSMFTTLVQRFSVHGHTTLLSGRETLWQAAWQLIEQHPLIGVGIGNSPYATLSQLQTASRVASAQNAPIHNPILTIWSETGILGILLYLAVLGSALVSFGNQYFRFKKMDPNKLSQYFAIVSSITVGYLASWFKGGGMESHFSYFLILALLTVPSVLDVSSFDAVPSPSAMSGKQLTNNIP